MEAGRVSATQFLSLLGASVNEDEYVVWGTLDNGIAALANVLSRSSDPTLRSRFDKFIVKTLAPVAQRLGWEAKADEGLQGWFTQSFIADSQVGHAAGSDFWLDWANAATRIPSTRHAISSPNL